MRSVVVNKYGGRGCKRLKFCYYFNVAVILEFIMSVTEINMLMTTGGL